MLKTTTGISGNTASNDPLSELDQLRQIMFGQAKQSIDEQMSLLNQRLNDEIEEVKADISEKYTQLNKSITLQHEQTIALITNNQMLQENDKAELLEANNKLSSQIEITENSGKDDTDLLQKRMDSEVKQLEKSLENGIQELLARLEQVAKDLSSSKTDRKTLAQLLATMATNLETNT